MRISIFGSIVVAATAVVATSVSGADKVGTLLFAADNPEPIGAISFQDTDDGLLVSTLITSLEPMETYRIEIHQYGDPGGIHLGPALPETQAFGNSLVVKADGVGTLSSSFVMDIPLFENEGASFLAGRAVAVYRVELIAQRKPVLTDRVAFGVAARLPSDFDPIFDFEARVGMTPALSSRAPLDGDGVAGEVADGLDEAGRTLVEGLGEVIEQTGEAIENVAEELQE
ncbi:MAG: hypothetical protein AAF236_09405 [Verrucomicrobiota bacterium]